MTLSARWLASAALLLLERKGQRREESLSAGVEAEGLCSSADGHSRQLHVEVWLAETYDLEATWAQSVLYPEMEVFLTRHLQDDEVAFPVNVWLRGIVRSTRTVRGRLVRSAGLG